MSNKVGKYKRNKYDTKKVAGFNWLLLPLAVVVGVIPLIVYEHKYNANMNMYDFFAYNDAQVDFFLYHKALTFIIISAVMAGIVIAKLVMQKKNIKFKKLFIPLGIYAVMALLSSIFSEYSSFCFTGSYEQFESVWVLLGYCLLAYYTFLIIGEVKDISILLKVLTASTIIMLLIGLSQAFSADFYRTTLGKSLIAEQGFQFDFKFELGRVYMALYNPNYVGSYAALLSPVFLMLMFETKKKQLMVLYGAVYVGLLLALFGSESRAGFIGIIASLVLLLIVFNKVLIKKWIPAACIAVLFLGALFAMNYISDGELVEKIAKIFKPVEEEYALQNIETNDDDVTVTYNGEKFIVSFVYEQSGNSSFFVYDESGKALDSSLMEDEMTFAINDERFPGFELMPVRFPDESIGFGINIDGHGWYFTDVTDGTYYHFNIYGKLVKLGEGSETFEPLMKYPDYASGRGYIWAKSIPLLKDNLILGSGPDTFIFEFPNDDFLAVYNSGFQGQAMTKPHCMYLQIGVQTGVVSLLAVLAFYGIYFFWSMKLYIKRKEHEYEIFIGKGILAGTFGYMVVGLINDSTVTVAPLFWCLMGIGIAVNVMTEKKYNPLKVNEITK